MSLLLAAFLVADCFVFRFLNDRRNTRRLNMNTKEIKSLKVQLQNYKTDTDKTLRIINKEIDQLDEDTQVDVKRLEISTRDIIESLYRFKPKLFKDLRRNQP